MLLEDTSTGLRGESFLSSFLAAEEMQGLQVLDQLGDVRGHAMLAIYQRIWNFFSILLPTIYDLTSRYWLNFSCMYIDF